MQRTLLLILIIGQFCICHSFVTGLFAEEYNVDDVLEVFDTTTAIQQSGHVEINSHFDSIELSLDDSFILALRNNFDIKISEINSEIKEYGITAEKSRFDPVLKLRGEFREDSRPINSQLVGGIPGGDGSGTSTPVLDIIRRRRSEPSIPSPSNVNQFFDDRRTFNASIETLLPTGAIFGIEYNYIRSFVKPNPFNLFDPAGTGYIEASFTQPLLKNFGIFKTRSPIYIARNNKRISDLQFKKVAIDILNLTQTAYWNLVKSIDDFRVSKVSLKRANDLLEKNRIQVEIGTLAPIELVQAEDGVAKQEEAVIITKHSVKDREDELKQILNFDESTLISDIVIIPKDSAVFEHKKSDLNNSIKIAIENRPDYLEKKLEIDNANINVKQRKNEVLPQLDLVAGVRYSGLGADFGEANEGIFSEKFQGEYFGINFEVPIGMRAARSNYKSAKLQAKQAHFNIKKKEQEIVVEVRKAVRQIDTNIQRIKATKKARELAQKRLDAEEKKYEVGRSTSLEVLRAQENLAIAEGNEIKAVVDYNISLKNLEAVQGTILEDNDVVITN